MILIGLPLFNPKKIWKREEKHMDRIAVISDIHGNIPALEAVLADIESRGIDRIICLGDLAGKGPSSAQAVDRIMNTCEKVVKGNWDHFLASDDTDALQWHRDALGGERLNYLRALEVYFEFYMSGKLVRLCHASPNDIFHRTHLKSDRPARLKLFEPTPTLNLEADVVGYGDIHGAHVDNFEGKTVFNAGSVGNPLEITQASYAILEGVYGSEEAASFTISLARIPYDIEAAVSHAELSDMPEKEAYIIELRTAVYRGRHKK